MHDDLAMLKNPDAWPRWPVLPLKRPDSYALAFVTESSAGKLKLYEGNIWSKPKGDGVELAPEDVIAAGWLVD